MDLVAQRLSRERHALDTLRRLRAAADSTRDGDPIAPFVAWLARLAEVQWQRARCDRAAAERTARGNGSPAPAGG